MDLTQIDFRLAKEDDAKEILSIYAPYVDTDNITFEYEVPSIVEFRQRIAKVITKYPYIVALYQGKIVGYTYASTFRDRIAYNWGLETSIYLAADMQGQNLGKRLYTKLEQILKLQNITNLVASITYPNPQSINFHEKMGYRKIAHFTKCGYKQGKWYDMIFMEKFLNKHENPAKDIIYINDLDKTIIEKILQS